MDIFVQQFYSMEYQHIRPLQVWAIQQLIGRSKPGLEAEKMKIYTQLCHKWDFVAI